MYRAIYDFKTSKFPSYLVAMSYDEVLYNKIFYTNNITLTRDWNQIQKNSAVIVLSDYTDSILNYTKWRAVINYDRC